MPEGAALRLAFRRRRRSSPSDGDRRDRLRASGRASGGERRERLRSGRDVDGPMGVPAVRAGTSVRLDRASARRDLRLARGPSDVDARRPRGRGRQRRDAAPSRRPPDASTRRSRDPIRPGGRDDERSQDRARVGRPRGPRSGRTRPELRRAPPPAIHGPPGTGARWALRLNPGPEADGRGRALEPRHRCSARHANRLVDRFPRRAGAPRSRREAFFSDAGKRAFRRRGRPSRNAADEGAGAAFLAPRIARSPVAPRGKGLSDAGSQSNRRGLSPRPEGEGIENGT